MTQVEIEAALAKREFALAKQLLALPLHDPSERSPDGRFLTEGARERWKRTLRHWLNALDLNAWETPQLEILVLILGMSCADELPPLPWAVFSNALLAAAVHPNTTLALECTSLLVALRPGLLAEVWSNEALIQLRFREGSVHLELKGIDIYVVKGTMLELQYVQISVCNLTPFMHAVCHSAPVEVLKLLCPANHPETYNTAITVMHNRATADSGVYLLTPLEVAELVLASFEGDPYWSAVDALLRERLISDTFTQPTLLPPGFSSEFFPCTTYAGNAPHYRYGCFRDGTGRMALGYVPDLAELARRTTSRQAEPKMAAPSPASQVSTQPPQSASAPPPASRSAAPPPKPPPPRSAPPLPAVLSADFYPYPTDVGPRHGYSFGRQADGQVGYKYSPAHYVEDERHVVQTHYTQVRSAVQSRSLQALRSALAALQQHCLARRACCFCGIAEHAPDSCRDPFAPDYKQSTSAFWFDLWWKCATAWGSVAALEAALAAHAACKEVSALWLNLAVPAQGIEPRLYMLKAVMDGRLWDMTEYVAAAIMARPDNQQVTDFGDETADSAIPQLLALALQHGAPERVFTALWRLGSCPKYNGTAEKRVLYGTPSSRSVGDAPTARAPFLHHAIWADNAALVSLTLSWYPARDEGWDTFPSSPPLFPLLEAVILRRLNAAGALLRGGFKAHIAGAGKTLGTPLGRAALSVPPSWALCASMLQSRDRNAALDFVTPVSDIPKGALSDIPLHLAAHANQAPLVDAALAPLIENQRRAALEAVDWAGNTLLHCALLGKPSGQIAATLIRASAPLWIRNAAGQTACSLVLGAFGKSGGDSFGTTVIAAMQSAWAAHVAALAKEPPGSQAACSFLSTLALDAKAAQCWPIERDWLCAHQSELLKPLLRRQDVAAATMTETLSAPPSVCARLLPLLLDEPDVPAAAVPLWLAAAALSPSEFRRLMLKKPRVDTSDPKSGDTALHAAARRGSMEMVTALLEHRARVDVSNRARDTPLHCAARAGAPDVARALLDAGAVATALNAVNDSPLHCAARDVANRDARHALCRLLAKLAPEVLKVVNGSGLTPVQAAAAKETKALIQEEAHAAHRERREASGQTKAAAPAKAPPQPLATGAAATQKPAAEVQAANDDPPAPPLPPLKPRCVLDVVHGTESDADLRTKMREILDQLPALLAISATPTANAVPAAPANGADAVSATPHLRAGAEATLGPLLPLESALERAAADAAAAAAFAAMSAEDALAAEEARSHVPASVAELGVALSQCVWQFSICSQARKEWARMDAPFRAMVVDKLLRLGAGFWIADGTCSQLVPNDTALKSTLELWRCKFSKAGRILFEVAPDWSSRSRCFQDMIRVWCITLDHDKYERERTRVEASHRRAQTSREKPALRRLASAPLRQDGQRLPQSYEEREANAGKEAAAPEEAADAVASQQELQQHLPPASSSADAYTLLKFFDMSAELLHACLMGQDETRVDFPFRVSQHELDIITHDSNPPAAMLLIGRSGTGKTTCAVYRLWARWLLARQAGVALTAIFITASATLRTQVAASFRRLRAATFSDSDANAVAEAEAVPLAHLLAVPDWRWPLFLTATEYLKLLDASLPGPFLAASSDAAGDDDDGLDLDLDGAAVEIDLFTGGIDSGSDDDGPETGGSVAAPARRKDARKEVTYTYFVNTLWKRITTKEQRAALRPALVYQEIRSYLAGSSESLAQPDNRLSLDDYLKLGKKRAPNFSEDGRRALYPIFLAYERIKSKLGRYDVCDLVASIYSRLGQHGWHGTSIRSILRDEVQDFLQAELLLDMRLVEDPSGILYCGDTAQTIARGVGFRFTDIRTLFHDEADRRRALGVPGPPLIVPEINCLELNYRTHHRTHSHWRARCCRSLCGLLAEVFPSHSGRAAARARLFRRPEAAAPANAFRD